MQVVAVKLLCACICLYSFRLRKKCYKSPSTIYSDDQVFDIDSISIVPNMDIFVEILKDREKLRVDNDGEMAVYIRRWWSSKYQLDAVAEVIVDEDSYDDLITKVSKITRIEPQNLQFAKLTGCFPCDVSVLELHDTLPWQPADGESTCCLKSLGVYTDGAVICCRDKSEPLKELTAEERTALERAEASSFLLSSSRYRARPKERALKIYTDGARSSCSSTGLSN